MIRRLVAAARSRLRLRSLLLGGFLLLDLVLLWALLGLPATGPIARHDGFRLLYFAGLVVVVGFAALRFSRRSTLSPSDSEVARHLSAQDACAQVIGDGLTTAVELLDEPPGSARGSDALVRLHVARVGEAVAGLDPRRLVDFDVVRRPARLALALLAVLTAIVALSPDLARGYLLALGGDTDPGPGSLTPGLERALGQIKLTYRYPAYTRLGERVVEGATGDMRAIRGTEIGFEAKADGAADSAWLRFGDDTSPVKLRVTGDNVVAGEILAMQDTTWHAELRRHGRLAIDPMTHTITVDDDDFPKVELLAPAEDIEVDELAPIELAYRASDDFALGEAYLVVTRGGDEVRHRLDLPAGAAQHEAAIDWGSLELTVAPGEDLSLYVEVFDNDTVSGPKRSVTATRRLRVRSASDIHAEVLASIERLLDGVLGTTATTLVATVPAHSNVRHVKTVESEIAERISAHLGEIDDILRALWGDSLGSETTYTVLSEMRLRLEELHAEKTSFLTREAPALRRAVADSSLIAAMVALRAKETRELEDDSLLLDDLVYRERSDEVRRLAESLMRDQERLAALLEEYGRTESPDTLAEIQELIEKMERDLAQLNEAMSRLGRQAGEEFVNLDAMKQKMGKDARASLDDIKESLESGDVDAATERAEQLLKSLRDTLSGLGGEPGSALSLAGQRMFDQANQLAERLQALTAEEGKLVSSTDGVKREIESRRVGEEPDSFFERQRQRAQEIQELIEAATASLEANSALGEQRAARDQMRELEQKLRRDLAHGAPLRRLDEYQREIFALRQQARGAELAAFDDLAEAAQAAQKSSEALAGPWLEDALQSARELDRTLRDASDRLESAATPTPAGADGSVPISIAPAGAEPVASPAADASQPGVGGAESKQAYQQASEMLADLRALDRNLRRPASEDASEADERRLGELGRKQGALRTEADEVRGLLEELQKEMPEIPPELGTQLEQAGDYMELASRSLEDGDVDDGLHNEQLALERLQEAMQSAQQAAQACQGGSGGGGGGSSGGSGSRAGGFAFIPSGVDGPPRFRDSGEGGQSPRTAGLRGQADGKVEIPGAGEELAPEEFRRDVLEGMKEPRPEGYQELLEEYYRRLVQ